MRVEGLAVAGREAAIRFALGLALVLEERVDVTLDDFPQNTVHARGYSAELAAAMAPVTADDRARRPDVRERPRHVDARSSRKPRCRGVSRRLARTTGAEGPLSRGTGAGFIE